MRSAPLLLTVLLALRAAAGDAQQLYSDATTAYGQKQWAKAAELYVASIEAGMKSPDAPYNAACCFALGGKTDEAFTYLRQAVAAGWRDVAHLSADSDLNSLHADARWQDVLDKCRAAEAAFAKSLKEPALRAELLQRMQRDQAIRRELDFDNQEQLKEMARIDAENTAWMKGVIEKHGWPGNSMVGPDGALAAFLIVQHAPDQAFMAECLPRLEKAWKAGEAQANHVALMTDRVLMQQGKPQRYGSQFRMVDGKLEAYPIEDEEHVDDRRKEMGLEPLAAYRKRLEGMNQ